MMKLEIGGSRSNNGWKDINLSNFDLRKMEQLPFEDKSIDKVFSSHCIEHIENRHNIYLFKELKRIMKSGAVMRLSCPDADLLYEAYGKGEDKPFKKITGGGNEINWIGWNENRSKEELLINCFVSYGLGDGVPNVHPEKVKKLYKELPKEEFLNWTLCHVDRSRPYIAHINWFNYDKLSAMLEDAGFIQIERAEYGGSKDEEFKNGFDLYPEISLYVECYNP